MSGLVNAVAIVAVVVVVVARQFRARAIGADRRRWLLPLILAVVALREPGILDKHHHTESAMLLGVGLLIGLATGSGWAWTTRIWTAPDGVVWTKSTKASVAVWGGGVALRAGVVAVGSALGLHQGSAALMLGLAGTLLIREAILVGRVRALGAGSCPVPAHGEGRPVWEECV
ncbi:DUF1453 domain-containing protein [Streptomyces pluripotens]|uniref:DUF1453 domain-containing protein n=1 Tax=Streptomyces pluripotens TaxID=1355015 RepID=A0A221P479_9ACTN|nr:MULTISPECIES: DUF1453 family protein [Streptomyces]ARP72709.1 DUF1453 domain-containing protein [Streptomyces pluripotens]ASN26962.1 DUF1453 domain-containing protein [Streptomyces pluripotens]KIE26615.1 membrane protein [Streptomyces sp. MUSC 125]